ncbi:Amidohydrolase [Polystyrenella longa]|uniref:Amidohydrolase n=1 Tax=Polystyrenella longa TaxID=2528007 RepID=A0A518CIN1_9PLAN|nr:amidohydrolase family protein [Polystyrenella longa]QDU79047.1 Amidohydrolase [Polystyrenella longa]
MISRRDFHRTLAAGALAGMTGSLFSSSPELRADDSEKNIAKPSVPYIDMHTHIGQYVSSEKNLPASGLIKWMDENYIEKAVVLPLVSPESTLFLQPPELVLAAANEFPDRLIPFCCYDPRHAKHVGNAALINHLKRYKELGAKGFGEHKVGLDFNDPLMMKVYAACEEVGLPVLFHLDTIRGKDKPGLPHLEEAIATFPDLTFIGHGPGWWASISGDVETLGGYPTGDVAPGGAIDRLMEKYPNIYGDLSAGSGNNAIARDMEFGREFLIRRQDRICFGSDYLAPGQVVPQFETLQNMDLPLDVQEKIFRGNTIKVLDLS